MTKWIAENCCVVLWIRWESQLETLTSTRTIVQVYRTWERSKSKQRSDKPIVESLRKSSHSPGRKQGRQLQGGIVWKWMRVCGKRDSLLYGERACNGCVRCTHYHYIRGLQVIQAADEDGNARRICSLIIWQRRISAASRLRIGGEDPRAFEGSASHKGESSGNGSQTQQTHRHCARRIAITWPNSSRGFQSITLDFHSIHHLTASFDRLTSFPSLKWHCTFRLSPNQTNGALLSKGILAITFGNPQFTDVWRHGWREGSLSVSRKQETASFSPALWLNAADVSI